MEDKIVFEKNTFSKRTKSMMHIDMRRMFKSKLFYILIACALIIPILMTVMMSMMDGSVSTNPQTGEQTVMKGPENTWQNIGTIPGAETMGGMYITRQDNARALVLEMDKNELREFLQHMRH